MLNLIFFQLRRKIPVISILLMGSCLVSTLPQFFLSDVYSDITGQVASTENFYFITLSSFTHSPEILIQHLIGNLLVIVFLGIITEIIIGSERFALISLITLVSTTGVNYLHTSSSYIGHGASGIVWGYHIFFMFFTIIAYEIRGKKTIKDGYIIFSLVLFAFDLIGIQILEVVVLKIGFFDNFGQVLHLISMVIVIPLIIVWRRDIEINTKLFLDRKLITYKSKQVLAATIVMYILLALNVYGTFKAICLVI